MLGQPVIATSWSKAHARRPLTAAVKRTAPTRVGNASLTKDILAGPRSVDTG
jgi:hypothetical protein